MHRIAWLALVLFALGWLACEVEVSGTQQPRQPDPWRRTLDGWEKKTNWEPFFQPPLHPAVVGLFELFAGLTGLAVFPAPISAATGGRVGCHGLAGQSRD
ncbi:MAG: hypothetical protein ACYC35_06920 [Pirellulales bacterium]